MAKWLDTVKDLGHAHWQVQAAALLVAVIASVIVYSISWNLVDGYHVAKLPSQQTDQAIANEAQYMDQNLKRIVNAPVFGVYKSDDVERVNTTLSLLGVMSASDKSERRAFISEPKEDASVYFEGDEISKGLKVHRIYGDRVILTRFGTRETLYISWDELQGNNSKNGVKSRAYTKGEATKSKVNRQEYLKKLRDRFKNKPKARVDNPELKILKWDPSKGQEDPSQIHHRFDPGDHNPAESVGRLGRELGVRRNN